MLQKTPNEPQVTPVEVEVIEPELQIIEIPWQLDAIGRCESGNRQFTSTGEVLRGRVNSKDIGKYQINEYYHLETAKKLGLDIYTEEGNTEYALYLYEHQGTAPWIHSKPCHGL